ncbi:unnamed protein product [Orchesella dallaii]|uniref:Large ribosomal subunit protein uL14m n=1 Tax=Orchesella dallaii TaxID=48710 RepID=A0ABP1PMZ8_9HEXA
MSALQQGIASSLRLFVKASSWTSPTSITGSSQIIRNFHPTPCLNELRLMSRVRCVDNSAIGKQAMAEGKPPKVIHVYNKKKVGTIGDKVLVTVKGEMKKAIIVGVKRHQKHAIPRHDTNNVVLIDDNGTPLGTRISVPVPMLLRKIMKEKTIAKGADYTKVLSIASRFV